MRPRGRVPGVGAPTGWTRCHSMLSTLRCTALSETVPAAAQQFAGSMHARLAVCQGTEITYVLRNSTPGDCIQVVLCQDAPHFDEGGARAGGGGSVGPDSPCGHTQTCRPLTLIASQHCITYAYANSNPAGLCACTHIYRCR